MGKGGVGVRVGKVWWGRVGWDRGLGRVGVWVGVRVRVARVGWGSGRGMGNGRVG